MTKFRFSAAFLALAITAGVSLGLLAAPARAQAPAQWNYTLPPSNIATATYPGNVTILGTCTGCSGGGVQLNVPQTWTAVQTFSAGIAGTAGLSSASVFSLSVPNIVEAAPLIASGPPATVNYDALTQSVLIYGIAAANNWTLNIRGSAGASLNSIMALNQSLTLAFVSFQGATPFFNNVVQIDGSTVTPKWQGGAPVAGNANGFDVYTFTIFKTGVSTFIVLASQVQFK